MQFKRNQDSHLLLIEFTYNNCYHSSVGMTPFEALYGKQCRTPLCWDEVGERKHIGPEFIQMTTDKVKVIHSMLKATQDRQKSYVDNQKKTLSLMLKIMCF